MHNPSSIGRFADKLYRRAGDKGIQAALYFFTFAVHTAFAVQMSMISIDPNEFGTAAWAALYTGKDWSGVMNKIGYYYGYVLPVLYAPLMYIIHNPVLQYKAFLVLCSALVSFVPVIAYRVAGYAGMEKAWARMIAAALCGMYATTFAHTKFIWNETACVIFPWIIFYVLHSAWAEKNRRRRVYKSVILAFVIVLAFAAHERLSLVGIAAVAVAVLSKFFFGKRGGSTGRGGAAHAGTSARPAGSVALTPLFISLSVFLTGEYFLRRALIHKLWAVPHGGSIILQNTPEGFFENLARDVTQLGRAEMAERLAALCAGHLYYFNTATWGFGCIAICLFAKTAYAALKRTRVPASNGTRGNGDYSSDLFTTFSFLCVLLSGIGSVLAKVSAPGFSDYQDTVIFGRYMDCVMPLLILAVLAHMFRGGLTMRTLLTAGVTMGVIYTLFFIYAAPLITGTNRVRVSPILGLYPLRLGERIDALITQDGLLLTVSVVFSFLSMFIVIINCFSRFRNLIMSAVLACTVVTSSIYTATVYLPFCAVESAKTGAPLMELSGHVYNTSDSPPLAVLRCSRRVATVLQYLNQNTRVVTAEDISELPEHCFVVARNDLLPQNGGGGSSMGGALAVLPFTEIGRTGEYRIYAKGERAEAYALSQIGQEETAGR